MAYAVGIGLAIAVGLLGTLAGLDRDRAFYSTVTIVVASYYGLFAVMGGSMAALAAESVVMAGFLLAAVTGFRRSSWILVAALAAHGLFDAVHGRVIVNPGMPSWWPPFCGAYDVTAAGYLASLLMTRRRTGAVASKGGDQLGDNGAAK
ncbi:MAG TPA: hypothetical protein VGQ33_06250 [Vicinamibacteria bacterium]|nr:hypothetical protein [Vicinamibacteria bacterium]